MLSLVVLLIPLVSAIGPSSSGMIGGPGVLMGYNPVAPGFLPQASTGLQGVYSGYYPRGFANQASGAQEYQRGGQEGDYRNYAQNARANEIIRDAGGVSSRDADGWSGNQMVAREGAGGQGYYKDAGAARFHQQGNGAAGAATKYGVAGQNGFDGYGDEGHQKGHKTSGFHKSYHNIESGKDTKFIDEDHNIANQKYGQAHDAAYGNNGWGVNQNGRNQGLYADKAAHASGAYDALQANGAHRAGYDSHDVNGYYHNQNLAHKRGQELAEDQRLVRDGMHGMRARNGGIYHNELW